MRILFVASATEIGGAEFALLHLLENLSRSCVDPFFVSLGFGDGDLPRRVAALGIPAFEVSKGRYRQLLKTARKAVDLVQLIRRYRMDLVFSNGGHSNIVARPAARLAQVPSAWWVHGYDANDVFKGSPLALAQTWAAADLLVANSAWTARQLARHLPGRKIHVIPPGTDCRRFRPAPEEGTARRKQLGIGDGELVVGIFGRLQPWKGQHIFLRAAAILSRRGLRCRFLVVGGTLFGLNQGYPQQLEQIAGENAIQDRVHFLGQRDDVNAWMNACDVVVHASTDPEPWGLVIAEAMCAGRAVVASGAGGPLEMIRDGETGVLFPAGNPEALASAIESLARDAEARRRIGAAARLHAEQHFDIRQTAHRMCETLQQAGSPSAH